MLAITLPKDVESRLTDLALKTGRTKTYYARKAILEYLEDMEDVYLAMSVLEKKGRRWTMEEVEAELDLEN
jgi:RHH-type rel operon transcriptional repressor/antitoxin RelB